MTLSAVGKNYTVTATGVPIISGTVRVGGVLSTTVPDFSSVDGPIASPNPTYPVVPQRYRGHRRGRDRPDLHAHGIRLPEDHHGARDRLSRRLPRRRADLGRDAQGRVSASSAARSPRRLDQTACHLRCSRWWPSPSGDHRVAPSGIRDTSGTATGSRSSGATHVTYTPVALDYGKTIGVRVIATKLDYTSQLVTTTPVELLAQVADYTDPDPTPSLTWRARSVPRITGEVKVGARLDGGRLRRHGRRDRAEPRC